MTEVESSPLLAVNQTFSEKELLQICIAEEMICLAVKCLSRKVMATDS